MIKVVVGKNDRVVATHAGSEDLEVEMYEGAKLKGETLKIVKLPNDAVRMGGDTESVPTSTLGARLELVPGWKDRVIE